MSTFFLDLKTEKEIETSIYPYIIEIHEDDEYFKLITGGYTESNGNIIIENYYEMKLRPIGPEKYEYKNGQIILKNCILEITRRELVK